MTFTIQTKAIPWNQLVRKNHWTVSRIFNELREATHYASLSIPPMLGPLELSFHFKWKEQRRHDLDSVCVKPIIDQLVDDGLIIGDDDLTHVIKVSFTGEVGAAKDEIVVSLKSML